MIWYFSHWKMSPDPRGCGNSTVLLPCCKLHAACFSHVCSTLQPCLCERVHFVAPWSDEESSSRLAVIVVPCLLTLSTVLVVALIFYSLRKNKERVRSAGHFRNGRISNSLWPTWKKFYKAHCKIPIGLQDWVLWPKSFATDINNVVFCYSVSTATFSLQSAFFQNAP